MPFTSPSKRASERPGSSPLSRELARARRLRWLGVGAAAVIVLVVLWAVALRPPGIELLAVVAVALLLIVVLYGLEVAVAEWRSPRLLRLAGAEEQRRRTLAEALARSEAVDVAARNLVEATTPTEAADRLLAAAARLVPAGGGAVVLAAGDDLIVSMGGGPSGDVPTLTTEAEELAGRVLAGGATARCSRGTAEAAGGGSPKLALPLRAGADVVGVLVLERVAGDADFTTTEQRVLERLAPHGALALARTSRARVDGVPWLHDRWSSPRAAEGGGPSEVDLAALLHEFADGQPGAGSEPARRIVVLASGPALLHTDEVALRAALAALLRRVDVHAPDGGAMAVELLPFDQEVEIVVAHGGGVLPERALDEPMDDGGAAASLRGSIIHLGGTVHARERSGVAQVRVRLPVAGPDGVGLQQPHVPVDTSVRA